VMNCRRCGVRRGTRSGGTDERTCNSGRMDIPPENPALVNVTNAFLLLLDAEAGLRAHACQVSSGAACACGDALSPIEVERTSACVKSSPIGDWRRSRWFEGERCVGHASLI
jgi:hypothetical protein